MDKFHSEQPKYEPLVMPAGELKAKEVEVDHFVTEEHFAFPLTMPPVPIHHMEPKIEPPEEEIEILEVDVHESSKRKAEEPTEEPKRSGKFDLEEVMERN